jgi:hypothetical protein
VGNDLKKGMRAQEQILKNYLKICMSVGGYFKIKNIKKYPSNK